VEKPMAADIPNLNYSGDLSRWLGKNFNYGDLAGLDSSLGVPAGGQPTFVKDGVIYGVKDQGNNTFGLQQIDTVAGRQQQAAQADFQAQSGSAIAGLSQGKLDLAGQYADLLKTVKSEYDPLINDATKTAGEALSRRGLTPDSQLFQTQTQGAIAPIYGQEAANAQTIGAGSISDSNTYNMAIANAKLGVAGTSSQLPLQYGQLALAQQALPSQIGLNQAQANQANSLAKSSSYLPTSPGVSFYDTSSNSAVNMAQLLARSMGYNLTK
jgi:hypothetical protein